MIRSMSQASHYRVQPGDARISDTDRDGAIEFLKTTYAEGRLDLEDFDLRLQRALMARTALDLSRATGDLRPPARRTPEPGRPVGPIDGPTRGEDRLLAGLAHATTMIPIVLLPAVIMATAGKHSPYVRRHAAEAVNLQLTLLLITVVTFGLGAIVYAVAWAVGLVGALLAVLGQDVRYPWILRMFGRQ